MFYNNYNESLCIKDSIIIMWVLLIFIYIEMPKILDRLVKQLEAKGKSKSSAFAIATSSLQKAGDLKKGTRMATAKGTSRGNMTPGARAKDRASKVSGKSTASYKYNSSTNRATLKSKRK